jgi:hypothetical protein
VLVETAPLFVPVLRNERIFEMRNTCETAPLIAAGSAARLLIYFFIRAITIRVPSPLLINLRS